MSDHVSAPVDKVLRVKFVCYEEIGVGDHGQFRERFRGRDLADRLATAGPYGIVWEHLQAGEPRGRTVLDVLPEVLGLPFNNLVVSLLASLRPSCVVVVPKGGSERTDGWPWRVTVRLDEHGCVASVSQEVEVLLGSGSEAMMALREAVLEQAARRAEERRRDAVPPVDESH